MIDVLIAGAKALAVVTAVVVCLYGLGSAIADRPLMSERSTRSGDTPRHDEPEVLAPPD